MEISGLDLDRLPSVLAIPLAEYAEETDPLLRLWHLCDVTELTLRTIVALGLSDWMGPSGSLPKQLKADIASRIEHPTLGKWRGMALALVKKPPKDARVPALYPFVGAHLDPLLRGTAERSTIETSLLELRNRLAHGGGMSRQVAASLLAIHAPRFESMLAGLQWLTGVVFIVLPEGGPSAQLTGPKTELSPVELSPGATAAVNKLTVSSEAVVAVAGDHALLLWPFIQYGVPQSAGIQRMATQPCPQIYARRGEVRLLLTPLGSTEVALADGSKAALAVVEKLVARDVEVKQTWEVSGFESELRRDASHLVGRALELEHMRATIAARSSGALWVTGPAGIGKSFLMAKLATDLLAENNDHQLVLPYRFKVGDSRCSRDQFLRYAVERVRKWTGAEKAGARKSLLNQLTELLEGVQSEKSVVFVLDGLDEIAAVDPTFASDVPLAVRGCAIWMCSGRSERGLPEAMADAAELVFPDGVPSLGAVDTRAMLLNKMGPLKKRLLKEERDAGEQAINPFVDRVVANADGLPIYVAYVIGDVLSGRIRDFGAGVDLPPSLEAYHGELLRGCAVGSLHQLLTPVVATLAIGHEAFTPSVLCQLLARRTLTPDDEAGLALVERSLAGAASMLRRVVDDEVEGSEAEPAYSLFHLSLRDHMIASEDTLIAIQTARDAMADAVVARPGGPLDGYLYRQGISHLLEAGRNRDAAALLSDFAYLMARIAHPDAGGVARLISDVAAVSEALAGDEAFAPWASFLPRGAHLIERGGAIALLQAAVADAATSPVSAAAEAWLDGRDVAQPWFRRLDRPNESMPDPCIRTFEGHASMVTAAAVSPDGRYVLSAGGDACLKLWAVDTGECIRTLQERKDSLSFAMVTSMPTAACLREVQGHGWTVWSVAMLGDGRRAVAAHGDRTLKVWDVDSGAVLSTMKGHEGYVWFVDAHPDGRRVVSASDDRTVRVWDTATGECELVLRGHDDWVACAVITPDGRGVVSAGGDRSVRIWDLETGSCVQTMMSRSGYVSAVAISADGGAIYSGSEDGSLARWNARTGQCEQRWEAHRAAVWSLTLCSNDTQLLSAGRDGVIHAWDPSSGSKLRSMRGHARWVMDVVSCGPGRALSASEDRTLKLWDLEAAAAARGRPSHEGPITTMAVDPKRGLALTGGADGTLKLWELSSGRSLRTFYGHEGSVSAVAFTGNDRALSAGEDGSLREWVLESGTCERTIEIDARVTAARFMDQRAFVGSADGVLRVWDLASGEKVSEHAGHGGAIWAIAVDAKGERVITASADAQILVRDIDSGRVAESLRGHSWDVQGIAPHRDGKRLVSVSRDKSVKVWNAVNGRCLATLERHQGEFGAVALWPDGTRAVTVNTDKTVQVWDLETHEIIAQWPADAAVTCIAPLGDQGLVLADVSGRITYVTLNE